MSEFRYRVEVRYQGSLYYWTGVEFVRLAPHLARTYRSIAAAKIAARNINRGQQRNSTRCHYLQFENGHNPCFPAEIGVAREVDRDSATRSRAAASDREALTESRPS